MLEKKIKKRRPKRETSKEAMELMLAINYVILDQSSSHEDEEKWFDFVLINGM